MAGTTTKSKRTTRKGQDVNDLLINYNLLIADLNTHCIMAPAPVIKAGGSALAKTGATATVAKVGGVLVNIAASTDLTALTGLNITANYFNAVLWTVDAAGTVTANFGTEATTLAGVVLPTITGGLAVIAGAYITHSSAFTGGTTALDTATTVYFSTQGPWYSAILAAKIGNTSGTVISSTAG